MNLYTPSCQLQSLDRWCLVVPSQQDTKVTVPSLLLSEGMSQEAAEDSTLLHVFNDSKTFHNQNFTNALKYTNTHTLILVFIVYKLYFLSPYPKHTHHTKPSGFLDFQITFLMIYKLVSSTSKITGLTILVGTFGSHNLGIPGTHTTSLLFSFLHFSSALT